MPEPSVANWLPISIPEVLGQSATPVSCLVLVFKCLFVECPVQSLDLVLQFSPSLVEYTCPVTDLSFLINLHSALGSNPIWYIITSR